LKEFLTVFKIKLEPRIIKIFTLLLLKNF